MFPKGILSGLGALLLIASISGAVAQPREVTPSSLLAPDHLGKACAFSGYWVTADDEQRGILELNVVGERIVGTEKWKTASDFGVGSGRTDYELKLVNSKQAEGRKRIYVDGTGLVVQGATTLSLLDARTVKMETETMAYVETYYVKILPKPCRV